MSGYKASYILTGPEILFLLESAADAEPSFPVRYILDEYLRGGDCEGDVSEGLVFKNMAVKTAGGIALEPVIALLVRSALSSDRLWIAETKAEESAVVILKARDMLLHAASYRLIENAWKITPYKCAGELIADMRDIRFSRIKTVDDGGRQFEDEPDGGFSWLEG